MNSSLKYLTFLGVLLVGVSARPSIFNGPWLINTIKQVEQVRIPSKALSPVIFSKRYANFNPRDDSKVQVRFLSYLCFLDRSSRRWGKSNGCPIKQDEHRALFLWQNDERLVQHVAESWAAGTAYYWLLDRQCKAPLQQRHKNDQQLAWRWNSRAWMGNAASRRVDRSFTSCKYTWRLYIIACKYLKWFLIIFY